MVKPLKSKFDMTGESMGVTLPSKANIENDCPTVEGEGGGRV